MGHLRAFACPDDELSGVGKEGARDVDGRVGFLPGYDVQDFESQLCKAVGYREDVVVRARDPNGAVVYQFVTAETQPFHVELLHFFWRLAFVPIAFIDADDLAAL